MDISIEKIEHYIQMLGEMALQFGVEFLLAVVVYLAGNFIIRRVLGLIEVALKKKRG